MRSFRCVVSWRRPEVRNKQRDHCGSHLSRLPWGRHTSCLISISEWDGGRCVAHMNQISASSNPCQESGKAPRSKSPGRPRSSSPRNRTFVIRASDAEATTIRTAAADARMPTAIYLRRRALNQAVIAPLPVSDVETATLLAAIGNNLDQAVRLMREGRAPGWPVASLDELRNLCLGISDKIAMSASRR